MCGNLEPLSKAEAIGSGLEEDAGNTFQLALTVAVCSLAPTQHMVSVCTWALLLWC